MSYQCGSTRSWHIGIVLLIVLALCTSVSTRTFQCTATSHSSAQSYPSHAMRQHMATDAAVFEKPVSGVADALLPVAAPHAPPAELEIRSVEFLESLYNRPPPSFFLL